MNKCTPKPLSDITGERNSYSRPPPALLSLISQCVVVCHIQCTAMLQAPPRPARRLQPLHPHATRLFQRFIFSLFTLACKCFFFLLPIFECFSCSVSSVCPPMCVKLFNKPCEQSGFPLFFTPPPSFKVNGTQSTKHGGLFISLWTGDLLLCQQPAGVTGIDVTRHLTRPLKS